MGIRLSALGVPAYGRYSELVLDLDLAATSRVELEGVLAACVARGTPESLADAAAIRAELASRTWQNVNPYAEVAP